MTSYKLTREELEAFAKKVYEEACCGYLDLKDSICDRMVTDFLDGRRIEVSGFGSGSGSGSPYMTNSYYSYGGSSYVSSSYVGGGGTVSPAAQVERNRQNDIVRLDDTAVASSGDSPTYRISEDPDLRGIMQVTTSDDFAEQIRQIRVNAENMNYFGNESERM